MGEKTLQDLLSLQGEIPRYIKEEAYILHELGSDLSEIESMIRLRTRAS